MDTDTPITYALAKLVMDDEAGMSKVLESHAGLELLLAEARTKHHWLPMESAPKDREILACWGTVASGAMGYDIVKHLWDEKWESIMCSDRYPSGGFCLQGWMPLPPLPNAEHIDRYE